MSQNDDNLIGSLLIIGAAIVAVAVVLFAIVTAFTTVSSAGLLWGLGISAKNFYLAARKNIGKGT